MRKAFSPWSLLNTIRSNPFPWLLALIILYALFLRFYGINWDSGFAWSPHPDERAILMKVQGGLSLPHSWRQFLDPETSPLNPRWFAYGSFPLYLLKMVGTLLPGIGATPADQNLYLVGRALSALFDVGTILVVYFLGRRLYGRRIGLLAAALVTFTVLHIQLSHFYSVDSMLAFFVVLTLFFAARIAERADPGSAALAGLAFGLALATKVSAAPLAFALLIAYALFAFSSRSDQTTIFKRILLGLPVTAAVAVAVFLITQPYALIDYPTFIKDVVEQSGMARGILDYPYTRQYYNTTPYLYQMQQLVTWGMGIPLGIAAWGGLAFTAVIASLRRRKGDLLLLAWVVPYFLIVGSFHVKYLRYLLPITPVLCLMAAAMLFAWWDWAKNRMRLVAGIVIGVVLAGAIFYSFAYLNIYTQPHPAVRVSQWVKTNIPPGSQLVKEHWEEGLPDVGAYRQDELNLYDADTSAKVEHVSQQLEKADYLVIFSNRLYGTIPQLPQRYPLTTHYYQLLFTGKLGFELVDAAASYPSLLGVTLMDDTFSRSGLPEPAGLASYMPYSGLTLNLGYADESFTVYDHPKVMLFKNARYIPSAELKALLLSGEPPPQKEGLMLSAEDAETQQSGGTWADIFHRGSLPNQLPALFWIMVVELFSLAALPLCLYLFRPLADRGYLLAKTLGILAIAYPTWLAASLHILPFGRGAIALSLLALCLLSLGIWLRHRKDMNSFLRSNWRLIIIGEVVFLGAFVLFYGIRLWNPDLWHPYRGGEKPMNFAYLNAIVKSTYMPPYDPWFAGGYLNYYYFGSFMVAALVKFTGIVPSVAFNLAVPLFFALAFASVFSLVYNLIHKVGRNPSLARSALAAALAGAAFVMLLGNLDGGAQLVTGLWQKFVQHLPFPEFDYWRSRSVMESTGYSITEFPYFTTLYADLHAHFIAFPLTVITIALGLVAVAGETGRAGWKMLTSVHHIVWLLALSLLLGTLRCANSWDFPTYFLLSAVVILIAEFWARKRLDAGLLLWAAVKVGVVYGLSTLFYLPFHQNYELFYQGIHLSEWKTYLYQYLAIHGLFLFLAVSFLRKELYSGWDNLPAWWRKALIVCWILLAGLFLALVALNLVVIAFLVVILGMVLSIVVREMLRRKPDTPVNLFVLALIGLALALGIGVDIFTLDGDIERMNTVFKFYFQGWLLFGVVAAYCLWRLVFAPGALSRLTAGKKVWLGFLALLLAACLVYPIAATPVKARERFSHLPPTNDGMAYMKQAVYHDSNGDLHLVWDYEAIRWIQDNIKGSPVIVEGVTPLYRWGSRVSIYTGLPTVIGWDWHQKQQRWDYQGLVESRLGDVDRLFRTTDSDQAIALLQKYKVRYIYVGELERLYYPASGIAKFDDMVDVYLEVVYQNQEVKIYRVK